MMIKVTDKYGGMPREGGNTFCKHGLKKSTVSGNAGGRMAGAWRMRK